MELIFNEQDLPQPDLEKLGLYKNGELLLDPENLNALLSGRRTELISLHDLKADGFTIERLDAKLSLVADWDDKLTLKIHPIYKEPKLHPLLLPQEALVLESGQLANLQKIYRNGDSEMLYQFEYDPQTKEFISYNPRTVNVPGMVNGETLSEKQKEAFRNGLVVALEDDTRLQYRAAESKGILSDRPALVLSVMPDDGGIVHLLVRDIKNLLNAVQPQLDENTEGFQQAVQELRKQEREGVHVHANSR